MKHTKGPWTVNIEYKVLTNIQKNTETRIPYYEVGSDLRRLATVDTGMNDEANAQLIAAAPELLEALKSIYYLANLEPLLKTKYSTMVVHEVMQQIADAIKKATGDIQ